MDLLILMVVVWTVGKVFKGFGLPVVFGELIGGIIVGPALLGIVDVHSEVIEVLAELGIFFLMLHAGLETDPDELFKASKKAVMIALGSILLPFFASLYVALEFGQNLPAALIIATGVSISAIALITRLFKDTNLQRTRVAHLTMAAAVVSDIAALILLPLVINLSETGTVEVVPLLIILAKVVLFFAIVIYTGFKSAKWLNKIIYFGNKGFTLTLIIALIMGLLAEAMGLHIIIGAFLAGLFMHEEVLDKKVFDKIEDRVYGLAYGFFGPIFFASLAFHLDATALTTAPWFLFWILVVAILGKIIGSGVMAHLVKMKPLESLAIGVAMNSRGAVELIIASIGLSYGIIDNTVFSILVLMAFVTTMFSIVVMGPIAKRLKAKA